MVSEQARRLLESTLNSKFPMMSAKFCFYRANSKCFMSLRYTTLSLSWFIIREHSLFTAILVISAPG